MEYKIGEFSKIVKISPRMLRFLDNEGILNPSFVADNGYRFYSDDDTNKASLIKKMRHFQFTYSEIKFHIENGTANDKDVYLNKLNMIKEHISNYEILLSEISSITNNDCITDYDDVIIHNPYEIYFIDRCDTLAYTRSTECYEEQIESFIDECLDDIAKTRYTLLGHYGIIFKEYTQSDMLRIQFIQSILGNNIYKENLEGCLSYTDIKGKWISTLHFGGYDSICNATKKLYSYASQNNILLEDDIFEKYITDSSTTSDSKRFVTEVSIKTLS